MRRSTSRMSTQRSNCLWDSYRQSTRRPTFVPDPASGHLLLRLTSGAKVCSPLAHPRLDNGVAANGARLTFASVNFGESVNRIRLIVDDFGAALGDSHGYRPGNR